MRGDAGLRIKILAVGFYRRRRDPQMRADGDAGVASQNQLRDLALPGAENVASEAIEGVLDGRVRALVGDPRTGACPVAAIDGGDERCDVAERAQIGVAESRPFVPDA